jgi:hypothetical protein
MIESKLVSVISYLRKKYPEENWQVSRAGFDDYIYRNNKNELAYCVNARSFEYDEEHSIAEFYIYRKDRLPERLYFD